MKTIKDELQYIILGDESAGEGSELKKTQTFLRGHAQTSINAEKQHYLKSEEAKAILAFAEQSAFSTTTILTEMFYKRRC